ncbi:MAG: AAC(3) family N-acetyltransferase [Tannerella sp.]|jgi:aminoglycoside 3-N-acetyltransferase|nr:AAC(3) family N-acetyltransferase [Tannerella sp.]
MCLKKIIANALPARHAALLRRRYRLFRQRLHRPMSEDAFRQVLTQRLGVKRGDTLFVHSSIDYLNTDLSAFRVLTVLTDVVGEEGLLLFPAWHFGGRAEDYLRDGSNVFDVKRSATVMGLLPELARRYPGAQRSIHPTSSIVAIGNRAKEVVSGHETSVYPCGESSPYCKMLKYGARIIGLGVNANFLSFIHCPEDVMARDFPCRTRTDRTFFGKVKLPDGTLIAVETLAAHENIRRRNIPAFLKKYVSKDIFRAYRIHGSEFYIADANALFGRIVELAKKKITVYNMGMRQCEN